MVKTNFGEPNRNLSELRHPARTAVGVTSLPGRAWVEIEIISMLSSSTSNSDGGLRLLPIALDPS